MARKILKAMVVLIAFTLSCSLQKHYDVVIRNATIYNGSGGAPYAGGVAIRGEKIVAVGDVSDAKGDTEIDAEGLAVAPGFINMLSWATTSLLIDGKSQSDIRQGVTLEVFGEGWSEGPLSEKMKQEILENQGEFKYNIEWTTLGEYLDYLVEKGISTNIASFVGATTVRIHELGEEDRPPAPEELERMRELVHTAMQEGALGLGTSLIYTPAFYAKTDELIELSKVASEYGGMYISHMRSEGNQLLEALDELLTIAREANIPAEIYHLKAAGKENWGKLDDVIAKIEAARADGLKITADMYNYIAGATGLDASMPPWVQEGGFDKWRERLMDDAIRKKIKKEMVEKTDEWENLGLAAGPEGMLLVGFKSDSLKPLTGKSLAEIAQMRGKSPQDVMIDLVIEDGSRVETVYFLMSEENVKRQIALPWMTFCSDAGSLAPEGLFLKRNPHPRAYGNFSRLLGKYVREEKVIPLEEAIKRLTSMPAENLRIRERGKLEKGYFADVVIFDPEKIQDHATFEKPHRYSTGMQHVFVNGRQVLKNGEHTGATPGQVVRGPGWTGWK
ncbi:MAG: D-aminoacylase [Deferribacteres bacterium]|nr:D-aminoacylase [Deferribacteres bacterium]